MAKADAQGTIVKMEAVQVRWYVMMPNTTPLLPPPLLLLAVKLQLPHSSPVDRSIRPENLSRSPHRPAAEAETAGRPPPTMIDTAPAGAFGDAADALLGTKLLWAAAATAPLGPVCDAAALAATFVPTPRETLKAMLPEAAS